MSSPETISGVIGKYEIQERIGGGGMGIVYRAFDTQLQRTVALKFLRTDFTADSQAKARLLVEARSAAGLDHPNVCTVYEVGETNEGGLYLVMPYYQGETLQEKIRSGPLPLEEAIDYIHQTGVGLQQAHALDIVHRDIKPANLLVTSDGTVKILDFGIAKRTEDHLTADGSRLGTLAYMSPEQLQCEPIDHRTDVWALGVVLYELLTGKRPFQGEYEYALMYALLHEEPISIRTLNPDIPGFVEEAIRKALSKNKENRFQRVDDLLDALKTSTEINQPASSLDSREPALTSSRRFSVEGERVQATIVVTSISGYFDLVEELAPDHLNEILSELEKHVSDIVARHQGIVYHFDGNEIVLLFGVHKSQEDDGLRAIRVTRELHRMVEDHPEALALQSAVASGSLIARSKPDDASSLEVTGKLITLVRRMAGRSEENTILLDNDTARLIRSHYEISEFGSLSVRGKGTPISLYKLESERDRISLVHGDIEQGLTAFTGRQRELDTIQRCYERVLGGEGQFVTVNGEAGLGKSRLSYEFRTSLKDKDVTLLMGRCLSHGSHIPYVPFIEILRAAIGIDSLKAEDIEAQQIVDSLLEISPDLEPMIPVYLHLLVVTHPEYALPEDIDGDRLRHIVNECFSALIIALSQKEPLVIVLDDWHWSDKGSRNVLHQWLEFLEASSIFVVLTYRPSFIPDWGHPECHTPIRLRALDTKDAESMIRDLTKTKEVSEDVVQIFLERTEGNPFFLEELINSMMESELLGVENETLSIQGELNKSTVPSSVQAVLRVRIERLSPPARNLLQTASVIGRSFSQALLKEIVPDIDSLNNHIDEIRKRGLLQQTKILPEIEYRFKHALVQEVVYDSLLSHKRKVIHGQVAQAFESLYPQQVEEQPFRLAQHYALAEMWSKAIEYGQKAANVSLSTLQYYEILTVIDLVLSWATRLEDADLARQIKLDNLLNKDYLCESLFLKETRKEVLQELFAELNSEEEKTYLCEYYIRKGDSLIEDFHYDEAEEYLTKGCDLSREIGNEASLMKALRSLGWLYWKTGRNELARNVNLRVLESLKATGKKDKQIGILVSLSTMAMSTNDLQSARTYVEEAERCAESGEAFLAASVYFSKGRLEYLEGDFDKAEKTLKYSLDIWDTILSGNAEIKHSMNVRVPMAFVLMGNLLFKQNRLEEAEFYLKEAINAHRSAVGRHDEEADSLISLGNFYLHTGRLEESIKQLENAENIYARYGIKEGMLNVLKSLAVAYEQLENYPGSFVSWDRLSELSKNAEDTENTLKALEGKVRVARLQQRDPDVLIQLQKDVLEYAVSNDLKDKQAELYNTLGILEWNRGRMADALTYFQTAFDFFTELEDAIHAGLMLNSIGAAQTKLNQVDEALATFQRALDHHEKTGEKLLKGHALAALGDIERERGDYEQALAHYGASLQLRWDIDDRPGEGWMLERIAKIHILQQTPVEARKELQKALEIARECGDIKLLSACEQALSNVQ